MLRQAGASRPRDARHAPPRRHGALPENSCTTEKGEVDSPGQRPSRQVRRARRQGGGAAGAAERVALKDPKAFKLLGKSLPRLDIPEKVNGNAEFGIDVKRPGMLVARVVRCPVFGGKVASFNADKAKAVAGVRHVVQISTGVAVVADNYWAASKGAQALEVKWNEGPLANAEQRRHHRSSMRRSRRQPGKVARNDGDADGGARRARAKRVSSASSKCRSWRTPAWSR